MLRIFIEPHYSATSVDLMSILYFNHAISFEGRNQERRAMSGDCLYESSLIWLLKACNAYFGCLCTAR